MRRPRAMVLLGAVLGARRACLATVVPMAVAVGWIGWVAPDEVDQAIALALFAQVFAAATGYREQACRGHFDQVLTLDSPKETVAAAHGLLSMAPGATAWLLVTAVVWLLHPTLWPRSLTASGLAAFVYVSCAAWAAALPLTRYASGVLWTIALFVLAGAGQLGSLREVFIAADPGWVATYSRAGAALVCPFFLISDPRAAGNAALCLVLCASALLVAGGVRFIVTLDVPLREPS